MTNNFSNLSHAFNSIIARVFSRVVGEMNILNQTNPRTSEILYKSHGSVSDELITIVDLLIDFFQSSQRSDQQSGAGSREQADVNFLSRNSNVARSRG